MRKRPPTPLDEPLDIFNNERLTSALAGAVEPTSPPFSAPVRTPGAHPARVDTAEPAASRAVSSPPTRVGRRRHGASAETVVTLPEPNVPLKFRVPQSLRSEFHRFKAELAATLGGVALDDSNLARPLVELFLVEQSERILEEASVYRGRIKRPPNGDAVGMAEFDDAIGNIFRRASRRRSPGTTS